MQIEQCERTAGHPLVVYKDEAKSGRALAGRQQLHQLMLDAADGKIGTLYVLRYDRLGRNEADTFTTVAELEDYGVSVISCQEGRDAITRGIHLVMAAHYSRDLSIKTRNGLLKRHEERRFTGGIAPLGYRVTDKGEQRVLTINDDEISTVRLIFGKYTDSGEPMGLKSIIKLLNDRGIPTRSQIAEQQGRMKMIQKIGRVRKPTPWTKSSIRSVLTNPIYIGVVVFNRRNMKHVRETDKRVRRMNNASLHQSYQSEDLRIISDELWKSANDKIAARVKPRGNARKASMIRAFTGHPFCEHCGSAFYSRKSANNKGVYIYYNCGCRQRNGPDACTNSVSIREDMLIDALQKVCVAAFDDIDGMVDEATAEARQSVTDNREQASQIRKEIASVDQEIAQFDVALRDPDIANDPNVKKMMMRQAGKAEQRRDALLAAIDALADKSNDNTERMAETIRQKLVAARMRWESVASSAQLNGLIGELIGPSIVTSEGRLLAADGAKNSPVQAAFAVNGAIAGGGFDLRPPGLSSKTLF